MKNLALIGLFSLFSISAIADTNFTDNGDGTVTDNRTNLTWQRCAVGQTWTGATCKGDKVWSLAIGIYTILSKLR